MHFISYAFLFIYICVSIHIGSPEGVTLLELEAIGEENQPEVQPEVSQEGEQVQELPECPEHTPTSYIKGKPQSILSLLFLKNIIESFICLMH